MRVLLGLVFVFGGMLASAAMAVALERPNIIILNETARSQGAEEFDRAAQRAGAELAQALESAGFAVFAPPALQYAENRATGDLMTAARQSTRPPLDIAILLRLEETTARYSYSTLVTNRLGASFIDIRSGRHLGAVQTARPEVRRAALDCEDACLDGTRSAAAAAQARSLAALLVPRLDRLDPQRDAQSDGTLRRGNIGGYQMTFVGFEDIDVADMEEYLVVFRGYRLHRPLATGPSGHAFWYETTAPRARLNRNLVKMLHHLRLEGRVDFANDSFTLTRASNGSNEEEPWDAW